MALIAIGTPGNAVANPILHNLAVNNHLAVVGSITIGIMKIVSAGHMTQAAVEAEEALVAPSPREVVLLIAIGTPGNAVANPILHNLAVNNLLVGVARIGIGIPASVNANLTTPVEVEAEEVLVVQSLQRGVELIAGGMRIVVHVKVIIVVLLQPDVAPINIGIPTHALAKTVANDRIVAG